MHVSVFKLTTSILDTRIDVDFDVARAFSNWKNPNYRSSPSAMGTPVPLMRTLAPHLQSKPSILHASYPRSTDVSGTLLSIFGPLEHHWRMCPD